MKRTKQLSVMLCNKRGELAALCSCLAGAKVNILALSVQETTELGTVRLVVDKLDKAVELLDEECVPFLLTDVLVASVPNKVGMLAEVTDTLNAKGVNIRFAYGGVGAGRGAARIVIGCDKMAAAEKALAAY